VGTASPRRTAQIRRLRPDLRVTGLRGNVETRLDKVKVQRQVDATLMAAAGLQRAGFAEHAAHLVDPDVVLPAAGQGALAVQCRADDHVSITRCLPVNAPAAAELVHAERAVVAGLDADCHSPVAVYATADGATVRLRARVLNPNGSECAQADEAGPISRLNRLVKRVLRSLEGQDARQIMKLPDMG
jgi:hydroxymethylbilane synthase